MEPVREIVRIGHDAIAHAQRALGRLDQSVDVVEAFGFGHAQAREQREDHQRSDALRRRLGVVDRPGRQFDMQRVGERRVIARDVLALDRTADAFEVGRHLASDVAAVKIVEAGMGKVRQRRGERLLLEYVTDRRRFAFCQESVGKARRRCELGKLLCGETSLAARHRITVAGLTDGGHQ